MILEMATKAKQDRIKILTGKLYQQKNVHARKLMEPVHAVKQKKNELVLLPLARFCLKKKLTKLLENFQYNSLLLLCSCYLSYNACFKKSITLK